VSELLAVHLTWISAPHYDRVTTLERVSTRRRKVTCASVRQVSNFLPFLIAVTVQVLTSTRTSVQVQIRITARVSCGCVCLTAYTGPTCEIQLSAYFIPSTSATFDLDPDIDLTQISFQLSVVEPSGVVFYVVSVSVLSAGNYLRMFLKDIVTIIGDGCD